MRPLTESDLLRVWEQGITENPPRRALSIVAAAYPEAVEEQLVAMPVGRRDGLLLDLRTATFGSQLECATECPQCAEKLELAFSCADVRVADEPSSGGELSHDDLDITFRVPTCGDLVAVHGLPDPANSLLERCVRASRDGEEVPSDSLPPAARAAVAEAMEKADPQALVLLDTSCVHCGDNTSVRFEIAEHLWAELAAAAQRLLYDVHGLASAYGWSEAEVLAVSPARRRFYLEVAGR